MSLGSGDSAAVGDVSRTAAVVEIRWPATSPELRVYVLLCAADNRLVTAESLLHSGAERSPDGAALLSANSDGDGLLAQVKVHLEEVDPRVRRIRFLLGAGTNLTLERLRDVRLTVWDPVDGSVDASFSVEHGGLHKSLLLGDLARGQTGWSFTASGRGFEQGAGELIQRAGVTSAV